ncbi:MAG: aconitase family protein [Gemmatimonadales bacterium]
MAWRWPTPRRRSRSRTARVSYALRDGSVVIAAITSCSSSNPSVMIGAGLLARNALAKGLTTKPWQKTSLAPGSRVVTDYLNKSGLQTSLDSLGFNTVGYGCTTCIGNSGPLPTVIQEAIDEHQLVTVAVLSGNRNFEARVHPAVRANYLASPMLVVAFAIAGRVDLDLSRDPLGVGGDGKPVYLADIWPSSGDITKAMQTSLEPAMFQKQYGAVFEGDAEWRAWRCRGQSPAWDQASTYVQEPPFFIDLPRQPTPSRTSRALGCSPRWATRSPPTTSPPRARSPRTGRRPRSSASTASNSGTGTPSGPVGATTK